MELINIAKKNLVDEAHQQMKQMIQAKVWREGEILPSEHKLCKDLGVSRVVVREVLQRLRAEKLIVTRQGVGSFVSNPNNFNFSITDENGETIQLTEGQFLDVMEFRKCIEFFAIELAVSRADEEDFHAIQQAVSGMEQAVGNLKAFSEEDYRFHYAIVKASHNEMRCKAMDSCKDELFYCFYQMNQINDVRPWGVDMHKDVMECLRKRDAKAAIQSLKKSNEYNYARLGEFFLSKDGPD